MKAALAKGPVGISVDADKSFFRNYESGIIRSSNCGTEVGHAVTAVGYGKDEGTNEEFVIIKNSWGKTWGDEGFGKILLS